MVANLLIYIYCVCVCVCVWERERERERHIEFVYYIVSNFHVLNYFDHGMYALQMNTQNIVKLLTHSGKYVNIYYTFIEHIQVYALYNLSFSLCFSLSLSLYIYIYIYNYFFYLYYNSDGVKKKQMTQFVKKKSY